MTVAISGNGTFTGTRLTANNISNTSKLAVGNMPTGSVVQVVQATTSTEVSTTSTSYVSAGLSASITPTSSSNKILILVEIIADHRNQASHTGGDFTVYRNPSTNLFTRGGDTHYDSGGLNNSSYAGMNYLDSPATTTSVTYEVYFKSRGSTQMVAHHNSSTGTMILMEIAA